MNKAIMQQILDKIKEYDRIMRVIDIMLEK